MIGIGAAIIPESPLNFCSALALRWENHIFGIAWMSIRCIFGMVNMLAWVMMVRSGCILLMEILTTVFTLQYILKVHQRLVNFKVGIYVECNYFVKISLNNYCLENYWTT